MKGNGHFELWPPFVDAVRRTDSAVTIEVNRLILAGMRVRDAEFEPLFFFSLVCAHGGHWGLGFLPFCCVLTT